MGRYRSEQWAARRRSDSLFLDAYACDSRPVVPRQDPSWNMFEDLLTYKRCIVELVVDNKQSSAKHVGDAKGTLARDAVGFAEGVNATSVVIKLAKRLMDGSIDHHTCVVHESTWSLLARLNDRRILISSSFGIIPCRVGFWPVPETYLHCSSIIVRIVQCQRNSPVLGYLCNPTISVIVKRAVPDGPRGEEGIRRRDVIAAC